MSEYPYSEMANDAHRSMVEAHAEAHLETLEWATRRMLQALDIYWKGYEGLPPDKYRWHGEHFAEDWWTRYEKYRKIVESCLAQSTR
jgi:hypothetical protein